LPKQGITLQATGVHLIGGTLAIYNDLVGSACRHSALRALIGDVVWGRATYILLYAAWPISDRDFMCLFAGLCIYSCLMKTRQF